MTYPQPPSWHEKVDAVFAAIDAARISVSHRGKIVRRTVTIRIPVNEAGQINVKLLRQWTERK